MRMISIPCSWDRDHVFGLAIKVSCDKMLLVLILKLSADIPPLTVFPS